MSILVNSVVTGLDEPASAAIEKALRLLGLKDTSVLDCAISKTSLDARGKGKPHFVHSVAITLPSGESQLVERLKNPKIVLRQEEPLKVVYGNKPLQHRPVVVGFGPAGMFAGLLLARNGYRPLVLERGGSMEERVQAVESFWSTGSLDETTNVQFGEGGAGTFSDGKLTTRIGDSKCGWVLREFVRFGAPKEILQKAKPHIGTDRLRDVVTGIRQEILRLGGEIHFHTTLQGLRSINGHLTGAVTDSQEVPAEVLVLATGHSARDTFQWLHHLGIQMEPKPFSVGVRVEHLQDTINQGLYGKWANHPALPVGEYQLSKRIGDRGVYTFCMCPGGYVVPAASQEGMVVTNGMSCYARDGRNANAALAVSVTPADYGEDPLAGMRFQQDLERKAFEMGGGKYQAPAQDAGSFLEGKAGLRIGSVQPTYHRGIVAGDFQALFPPFVTEMLRVGLLDFERKIKGFSKSDTLLTGVETRTSSPLRVLRQENLQSPTLEGLYPCAEGAGYAGGIMSAAVDGIRAALEIMKLYKPFE